MFRLYRLIVVLVIGCALTISVTRLAGGATQPMSRFASVFLTRPDGTLCQWPCLFGVRSEITPYLDGVETMRQHPFSRYIASPIVPDGLDWEGKNFTFVLGNYTGNVQRSPLVTSIYVNFDARAGLKSAQTPPFTLTAGEIISFMGKPRAISQRDNTASLYYPDNRLVVTISLTTRDIYSIDATDPDPVIEITIPSKRAYAIPPGSITP